MRALAARDVCESCRKPVVRGEDPDAGSNTEDDAVIVDSGFGPEMEGMFGQDIAASRAIDEKSGAERPWSERLHEWQARLVEFLPWAITPPRSISLAAIGVSVTGSVQNGKVAAAGDAASGQAALR